MKGLQKDGTQALGEERLWNTQSPSRLSASPTLYAHIVESRRLVTHLSSSHARSTTPQSAWSHARVEPRTHQMCPALILGVEVDQTFAIPSPMGSASKGRSGGIDELRRGNPPTVRVPMRSRQQGHGVTPLRCMRLGRGRTEYLAYTQQRPRSVHRW